MIGGQIPSAGPKLWPAVSLLSAAALAYEVLLTRLFAVVFWDHLAHMVISLALLGYGASGAFLALFQRGLQSNFGPTFTVNTALFALSAPLCFALAQSIPFNALELAWAPTNWLLFGAIYLVLSLPFFAAANAIALALWHNTRRLHRIYAADLAGAGVGAIGIVVSLFFIPPGEALRVISGLGLICVLLAATDTLKLRSRYLMALSLVFFIALWWIPGHWLTPIASDFKALPQAFATRGAEVVAQDASPLGDLTVVKNDQVPFRIAPGLSLSYGTRPPPQMALFQDGNLTGPITTAVSSGADKDRLAYLDGLPSALPYHLLFSPKESGPRVLLGGMGSGESILQAQHFSVTRIDIPEKDSALKRLLTRDLGPGTASRFDNVRLYAMSLRAFVARSQDNRFDLIQIDRSNADTSGLGSLSPARDLTVQALSDYLRVLKPSGMVAITHPLQSPPRAVPRLANTAIAALEAMGHTARDRILVIRGWRIATLVIKGSAFTPDELTTVRAFSKARSFDLAYAPGLNRDETNRYSLSPEPLLFDIVEALLGNDRLGFIRQYKFDLSPITDDRPFLYHSFRWRTFGELRSGLSLGTGAQVEWGYVILLATLIQAAVLSLVLILAPTLWARRTAVERDQPKLRVGLYFAAVGLAFLFVEIALIHVLQRLLQDPVITVSAVLSGFLVFAGIGSRWAPRFIDWCSRWPGKGTWALFLGIAIAASLPLILTPLLVGATGGWPLWARFLLSLGLIAPLALLMGMPFPLGLRRVGQKTSGALPLAWAVNGCFSVIGAVGAQVTALAMGFSTTVLTGVGLYLLAGLVMPAEVATSRSVRHEPPRT